MERKSIGVSELVPAVDKGAGRDLTLVLGT